MPISDRLAYSLNRRDQVPNKMLAQDIADTEDVSKLQELIEFLNSKPHRRLQMDAMLTIAYVGEQAPEMILPHIDFLVEKLKDSIDRVSWGSMIALSNVSTMALSKMYENLPKILDAMDDGSIVGRDHGYRILINLYGVEKYSNDLFVILLEQLKKAPPNQLGQYVERLIEVVLPRHLAQLALIVEEQRKDLTDKHHLKRLVRNLSALLKK
jgi:hypothetical protein